jgi:Flp pilus assembly pilin Flp
MYIKNKKGQSTVEYILLVTAVVAVMIVFVAGKNSPFQTQLNGTLNTVTQDMNKVADGFATSHGNTGY